MPGDVMAGWARIRSVTHWPDGSSEELEVEFPYLLDSLDDLVRAVRALADIPEDHPADPA